MGFAQILVLSAICSSFFISADTKIITGGTATYYEHYTPSACFGNEDHGNMVMALNPHTFDFSLCGKFFRVQCGFGLVQPEPCKNNKTWSVVAEVVNVCPPGVCSGDTDFALSKELYTALVDPNVEYIWMWYAQQD